MWYKVLNQKDGKVYKTCFNGYNTACLELQGLIVLCEIEDPDSVILPMI